MRALYFVVDALTQILLFLLVLRLWLPLLGADFRNPIAQAVLKITSPLVIPLRRLLPAVGRVDTATVVITLVVQVAVIYVLAGIVRVSASATDVLITAVISLVLFSINIFFFAIIIFIILSWIAPGTYNPVTAMLQVIAEPVLRPFRRVIKPIGGIDISPIFAIIGLQALILLIEPLRPLPV
jgi:YggT family protein